ncbi:hypothetical protein B0H15DRAFT_893540, partial [Mycena belliarum]
FGFGRRYLLSCTEISRVQSDYCNRACPGRHLAVSSVWTTAVAILATFNINKAVDETGRVIEPTGEYDADALISTPLPFKCSISPRSEAAVSLIKGI